MRHYRVVRGLLAGLLVVCVTGVGLSASASAQTLEDGPAPVACNTGVGTTEPGQDPWCLISFDTHRDDGSTVPVLGTYTLHVNPDSDTSIDVAMPMDGNAGPSGCDTCRQLFRIYQRDVGTNARVANGAVQLMVPFCAAKSGTCRLTFNHAFYPVGAAVDPGWVFWSGVYGCPSCASGNGVAEAGIHIIWDDSAPPTTAAFTLAGTGTAGEFQFSSSSASASGTPVDTWDFGNGHTGTGRTITHAYDKPGTYSVTLTATAQDGSTATATHDVVVKPPDLGVSIDFLDQDGRPVTTIQPAPGDTFGIRVTLSASEDGVGSLHDVTFTDDPLTAAPDDALTLDGPTPEPPDDLTLDGGDSTSFDYQATAEKLGTVHLTATVSATDDAGAAVGPQKATRAVNVGDDALVVTVTPSKNDFSLETGTDGKPVPETIDVTTKIENTADDPADDVDVSPLDLSASDKQHPYEPFPVTVVGANDDVLLGTIAPHETKTVKRQLKVTGDGEIDIQDLVLSSDGATVGLGQLRVGVAELLEMKIDGDAVDNVVAGNPFVVRGTFTNVTNDRTIAITDPIKALTQGNVLGGGYVARADGSWLTSDYAPPLITTLKPGASAAFQVRLATARPTVEDYDEGTASDSDWTHGQVSFLNPRAAVLEKDGTWAALTDSPEQPGGKYPGSIRIVGPGGAYGTVTVAVDTSQLPTGSVVERVGTAAFGFTEGALEGALNRLTDILGSTVLFTTDPNFRNETLEKVTQNQAVHDALTYLADFAVYLPQADRDELVRTAASQLSESYHSFTAAVVGGIPNPYIPGEDELARDIETYLDHLAGAWGRNDPNELIDAVRPVGAVVGEQSTDVLVGEATFSALAELSRAPKYLKAAAAAWRDQKTIAQMKANFPSAAQLTLDLKAQELSKSKYPLLESAFNTQRPLTNVDLGVGTNDDGAGLAAQTIEAARAWTTKNPNKTIVVIPNEANVAAVRDAQLAVGKIENIKPKSMARIEYAVFGGRPSDVNLVILRGDLTKLTKADVNTLVDQAIARGQATEEDRAVALQIWKKRNKEWATFVDRGAVKDVDGKWVPDIDPATGTIKPDDLGIGKLKSYDEAGKIPNQFRGVDNDLTVSGPEQYPGFEIQYYDKDYRRLPPGRVDEATYAVPTQESPTTGKLVNITGDDDGIFIGQLDGLGLAKSEINEAYQSLVDVFNHPFSDTWLAKINKKLEIFSRYFDTIPGTTQEGAPLVMFANGEAYAVKIDPWQTRFDTTANRAYISFVGAPRAVDPIAAQKSFVQVLLDKVRSVFLPASFLQMFQHQPNAASSGSTIPTAASGKIVRIDPDGNLESWTAADGWQLDPAAQAEAGALAIAPQTVALGPTAPGDTEVAIASQSDMATSGWFAVGDDVVLDPGGPDQETATLAGFGSLIFAHPLRNTHRAGELVVDLGPQRPGVEPGSRRPPSADSLAATGTPLGGLLGLAGVLVLLGSAVMWIGGQRNRSRAS